MKNEGPGLKLLRCGQHEILTNSTICSCADRKVKDSIEMCTVLELLHKVLQQISSETDDYQSVNCSVIT